MKTCERGHRREGGFAATEGAFLGEEEQDTDAGAAVRPRGAGVQVVGAPAQGRQGLLDDAAAQRHHLPAAVRSPPRAALLRREAGGADGGAGGDRDAVRDGRGGRDPAARARLREDLQGELLQLLPRGDGRGQRGEAAGEVRLLGHPEVPGGAKEDDGEGNGGGEAADADEDGLRAHRRQRAEDGQLRRGAALALPRTWFASEDGLGEDACDSRAGGTECGPEHGHSAVSDARTQLGHAGEPTGDLVDGALGGQRAGAGQVHGRERDQLPQGRARHGEVRGGAATEALHPAHPCERADGAEEFVAARAVGEGGARDV